MTEVDGRRGIGPLDRLRGPSWLRAACVPARHLLRNLRARARRATPGPGDAPRRLIEGARGLPALVARDEDGEPLCTACGLCAEACPSRCIRVGPVLEAPAPGEPAGFAIDLGRCTVCGRCEEVCPESAIVMSPLVALASVGRRALVQERDALLAPAHRLVPVSGPSAREATGRAGGGT